MNQKSKSTWGKLRVYLITGSAIVAPIAVTIVIVTWLIGIVDSLFGAIINIIPGVHLSKSFYTLPGVGLIIFILFLIVVGMVGGNFFGKLCIGLSDKILSKLPVVKLIYSTIKQIFDTLLSSKGNAFRQAVLVEYPIKGVWTVGFVTSEVKGSLKKNFEEHKIKDEMVSLFIPTTPNPTSGYLVFIPKDKIIALNISPNAAMKLIISGGVITGDEKKGVK